MLRIPTYPIAALTMLIGIALFPIDDAHAQGANYHWTISASDTDPFVQSTIVAPDLIFAYLWLVSCNPPEPLQDGMAAAEFSIVTSPNINHVATNMENGFLNAGFGSDLLIAVGGCPCGPVLAASLVLLVGASDPGVVCIGPNPSDGNLGTIDCSQNPQLWPMSWSGLGINAPAPPENCGDDETGGCCLPDGSCTIASSHSECAALGGTFLGIGTDCTTPCPTGACCLPDGTCTDVASAAECQALAGTFQGIGTDCATDPCAGAGACCLPDGSCTDVASAAECANLGGDFQGEGTDCATSSCTNTGACCLPDGSCVEVAGLSACNALGGSFQGVGTNCATSSCAVGGGCCLPNGTCVEVASASECSTQGGSFIGQGTTCAAGCPEPGTGVGWTISGSSTNPYETSVTLPGGVSTVYLWLACANLPNGTQGISAAEFGLMTSSPTLLHLATTPENGFLNAGSVGNLLLAVPGCPTGPVVAAQLLVYSAPGAPATMCFTPGGSGAQVVVNCAEPFSTWDFLWNGLSVNGAPPCSNGAICGGPVSVEAKSWGSIKAMYR